MLIILTMASTALAILMSVVAWRSTQAERLRSEARVAALARDIHGSGASDELPLRNPLAAAEEPASGGQLFTSVEAAAPSRARWGLAVAVGAFVIASVAAVVVVVGGDEGSAHGVVQRPAVQREPAAVTAAAVARPEPPLELVALSHERSGRELTVKGIVRNPASGTERDRLTALVVLLNADGNVVTTGRGVVTAQALIPGGESTFAVTIADAGDVARYRVSFRSDERVVAHVDRRTGS